MYITEDRPYSPSQGEVLGISEFLKTSHKQSELFVLMLCLLSECFLELQNRTYLRLEIPYFCEFLTNCV